MRIVVTKITDDSLLRLACSFTISAESNVKLGPMYRLLHDYVEG